MSGKIKSIVAREILDSRGNPTVEADLVTEDGMFRAAVPSGASTGTFEAVERRDGGSRYGGKGVLQAVEAVNATIAPALASADATDQEAIDRKLIDLDGTPNKGNLGANAILAVSMAAAKAGAAAKGLPLYSHLAGLAGRDGLTLPIPQMNVVNGGKHAGLEDDPQEFMILPVGASCFREAVQMGSEIYHALRGVIKRECGVAGTHLGDEGGFVPTIASMERRLELIVEAIAKAGYKGKVFLGLDCAASEFLYDGAYRIGEQSFDSSQIVGFYEELVDKFPIISIEDGMGEDDWEGWALLTEKLGDRIQLVGDDLLVTNAERVQRGIDERSVNSLLLKVNQIGTVTEAITAARMATDAGWSVVVSHRSGETEDAFIADLVVGLDTGQSKFGAPARTDRTAKYNQLLRIEEELSDRAQYGKFPYALPG
ncbi:MAG: phosphopyruvate hydratase [Candidatus Bipolaricaulia bacterium]